MSDDDFTEKPSIHNLDFNKIANDARNYLNVPKDSIELQYLYLLGEYSNERKKENIKQFPDAIDEWNKIIKISAKFIKELGLKNNYTSYYVIFVYLLCNGFFSKNMNFIFNRNNLLDLVGFHGLDVINGRGCCRSVSDLLNSISRELGFDTHYLVNSYKTHYSTYNMNIMRKDEAGFICPTRLNRYYYSQIVNPIGDHASVLVYDKGEYYIYDPTNLLVYKVRDSLTANLYNGDGVCYIKPWGFIMFENMKQADVLNLLQKMDFHPKYFMSDAEIKEIMEETLDICQKSETLMLDFYSQIENSIYSINRKLFKK